MRAFLERLKAPLPFDSVFNPWSDVDPENDRSADGPDIRSRQLVHYLKDRLASARFLLIGEAVGYQGGHFSGIAMTSERILLGFHRARGIEPGHVLSDLTPERTSRPSIKSQGFSEPTATIVWDAISNSGYHSTEFALWNAFAWHPYRPDRGMLSNRRPTTAELAYGQETLRSFIEMFQQRRLIAVGKVSAGVLSTLGYEHETVRHPAQGGAGEFRRQFARLLGRAF